MPALLAALDRTGYSLRLSRTNRMRSGESFGPAFETSAGSFCLLRWRPPPRPRLRPLAPSGVASVLGPSASLMAALAGGSSSALVVLFVMVAVTDLGGDAPEVLARSALSLTGSS